jgi:hypothetical protein
MKNNNTPVCVGIFTGVRRNIKCTLRFTVDGRSGKTGYEGFALFVEVFEHLPEFNDKQRSPKIYG